MQYKMDSMSINISLESFLEQAIEREGMYEVSATLLNVFAGVARDQGYPKKDVKKIIKHLHKVCDVAE